MHPKRWLRVLPVLSLWLLALPALAQDDSGSRLDAIVGEAREKISAAMQDEAKKMNLKVAAPTFHEAEGSTSAFAPIEGLEDLKREDLAEGVTLGLLMASGPRSSDSPSGTFRVWAKADDSGKGRFEILDPVGNVVQEGELTVDENDGAKAAKEAGLEFPAFGVYPSYQWGTISYTECWSWGCIRLPFRWTRFIFWYIHCHFVFVVF